MADKLCVLLQSPHKGSSATLVFPACSKKHFDFEDKGWFEIASGTYEDMLNMQEMLDYPNLKSFLHFYCEKTFSLHQTTEECLKIILSHWPDWLDDKVQVYF